MLVHARFEAEEAQDAMAEQVEETLRKEAEEREQAVRAFLAGEAAEEGTQSLLQRPFISCLHVCCGVCCGVGADTRGVKCTSHVFISGCCTV